METACICAPGHGPTAPVERGGGSNWHPLLALGQAAGPRILIWIGQPVRFADVMHRGAWPPSPRSRWLHTSYVISSSRPSHLPWHQLAVAKRYTRSTQPTPARSRRRCARRDGLSHTCAPVKFRLKSSSPAFPNRPSRGLRAREPLRLLPSPILRCLSSRTTPR
jgi:hypothetical protein